MLTSIVIPVYNGSNTIGPLVDKLLENLDRENLQIVMINDGSQDNSHNVCQELATKNSAHITYLNLSRNFGEHNAVMAGLHFAKGDWVVIMDDDFQNPPEEVPLLIKTASEGDFDVVYTYFDKKEHSPFRNIGSRFHNWMACKLLSKPKDLYLSSFKCMNRFLVDQAIKYTGPYPYLDGLILRCTNRIGRVKVRHDSRLTGKSGYNLKKLIRLWLNMFINFSVKPLRVSSLLGLSLSLFGLFLGLLFFIEWFIDPNMPVGWASLFIMNVTFFGFLLMSLGLLGEYLGSMFLANNQAPQFIVRNVCDTKEDKVQ